MNDQGIFQITIDDAGKRLDQFLKEKLPNSSRSAIQKWIVEGQVLVDGKVPAKSGIKLSGTESISLKIAEPTPSTLEPERIPLDILYEDTHLLVLNKAKGMVVHPAAGNRSGTLVHALLAHCEDLSGINGILRPGIVHRLDKDKSCVMLAAKDDPTHIDLSKQISDNLFERDYLAVGHGRPLPGRGRITGAIGRHPADRKKMAVRNKGGKSAATNYEVLEQFDGYALICCRLETGRTHQIRVHLASIGHPVVGDSKYGPGRNVFKFLGQALHSARLSFSHPFTREWMSFSAQLPPDMQELLNQLRKDKG